MAKASRRSKRGQERDGLRFKLSPQLFATLPKNEDLAVLTLCMLERHADPTSDPIGTLDATLGLFQRLPVKARAILERLRSGGRGMARKREPALAAWLDDDDLLDRLAYVADLAKEPAFSATTREDFEHVSKRAGERAHLESLAERTDLQERRFRALIAEERKVSDVPCGRTRRRVQNRIARLLPLAYRNELDLTFRQILKEGWGIKVATLTPAWREAVRFWLLVGPNRAHLEAMLRAAALNPGRSVKTGGAFPENDAWLASMRGKIDVDAWLAPRGFGLVVDKERFTIELEEDPLEVLRMGIPFATCLALADGCNAPSTILNAIDMNKRALYVRNESHNIIARKLIGVTDEGTLVGYRLYGLQSERERDVRVAVGELAERDAELRRVAWDDGPRRLDDRAARPSARPASRQPSQR